MGSIVSKPKAPVVAQPATPIITPIAQPISADTNAASQEASQSQTQTQIQEQAQEAREDGLLRRSRGRLGTISTGFLGVSPTPSNANISVRKTLLGE